MYTIKSVTAKEKFILSVVFTDGTIKEYDMQSLFEIFPQFRDFEKVDGLFEQVKVDVGGYGIYWNDDLDLDANDLWDSRLIDCVERALDEADKAAMEDSRRYTHEEVFANIRRRVND